MSKCQASTSSISIWTTMDLIISTSSSQKVCCSNSTSHSPVIGLISSATLLRILLPFGVITALVVPRGIHGSLQMFIFPHYQLSKSHHFSTPEFPTLCFSMYKTLHCFRVYTCFQFGNTRQTRREAFLYVQEFW